MDFKKAKGSSDARESDHIERKVIPDNAPRDRRDPRLRCDVPVSLRTGGGNGYDGAAKKVRRQAGL